MKPAAFDLVRAASVSEATRLLGEANGDARLVAGAQSLGPMLNLRLAQPRILIDITGIPELTRIEATNDAVTIGACVTTANIEDGCLPGRGLEPLGQVAAQIAYRAVRNRGTIGGSLCHADPAADWVSALCALGAECLIANGQSRRHLPVEQFVTAAYENALGANELLEAIRVPRLTEYARYGYYKICRKAGEFALAIGVVLNDQERGQVRLAIGATKGRPIVVSNAGELLHPDKTVNKAAVLSVFDRHGITHRVDRRQKNAAVERAFALARAP